MLAFVVENKTISRILVGIQYLQADRIVRDGSWLADRFLDRLGKHPLSNLNMSDRDDLNKAGQALLDLNVSSVNQRYNENDTAIFQFIHVPVPGKYQLLKTIRCFLYQASEGDCSQRPLYVALERLSYDLALSIVEYTEEYDRADWG